MVDNLLFRLGGEKLKETHLVAVCFVVDIKGTLWCLSNPYFLLLRFYIELLRENRLGLNTCCILLHVTVNQDGILGVSSIRINPVFSALLLWIRCMEILTCLGRTILASIRTGKFFKGSFQLLVSSDDKAFLVFIREFRTKVSHWFISTQWVWSLRISLS